MRRSFSISLCKIRAFHEKVPGMKQRIPSTVFGPPFFDPQIGQTVAGPYLFGSSMTAISGTFHHCPSIRTQYLLGLLSVLAASIGGIVQVTGFSP